MLPFNEGLFKDRIKEAIAVTRTVLDINKNPKLPSDVFHKYEDKYTLAESLATVGAAGHLNCLEAIGFTETHLNELYEWVHRDKTSVTIRLEAEEKCEFLRKVEKKVEGDSYVKETKVCL